MLISWTCRYHGNVVYMYKSMDIFYKMELCSQMQGKPLQRYLDKNRCISRIEIPSFHQVMRPNAHAAPYMYMQTYNVGVTSESRVK